MQLWQITIPMQDNDACPNPWAHRQFSAELAARFGGFTSWEANGAWADASGDYVSRGGDNIQYEPVRVYQVASSDAPDLATIAKPFFPDQKAFFVGRVGEADIIAV
jgi:hypothetical protein